MYAVILHPVCCIYVRKLGVTVRKTYIVILYRVIYSVTVIFRVKQCQYWVPSFEKTNVH